MAQITNPDVRKAVIVSLKARNEKEKGFESVVKLCSALRETVGFLEKENHTLLVQKSRLEAENLGNPGEEDQDITESLTLHKKIYQLQKELTDVHKYKGEHAQQVIDLRKALDDKEKELATKTSELEILRSKLCVSEKERDASKEKADEAENNLQLVKDEYSALYLTYSSLEKTKDSLEKEYSELVARWMVFKAKAADELNLENDLAQRLKQAKIQRDMEEAIQEPANLNSNTVGGRFVKVDSSLTGT